jgi:phage terminase large subunit
MMLFHHVRDASTSSVCLRAVQGSLKESSKRLLEQRIEALKLGAYFDIKDTEIRNRHGSGKIIFMGLQAVSAESIKSLEGYDIFWIDEAQSVKQRSLDILRPTVRKAGAEIWASWNPTKPGDPIELLLGGKNPPDGAVVARVNYDDNPDFPPSLRTEMEYDRKRDPDKARHVWDGEYETASEASIFKHGVHWVVADELIADDFEPPALPLLYGADWGFSPHPSALVRCWIEGKNLYVDAESVAIGVLPDDMPAFFVSMPDVMKHTVVADSENPQMITHMRTKGFKVIASVKGKGSVKAGLDFLKGYTIHVSPKCTTLIEELGAYSYKINPDVIDPLTQRAMITTEPDEDAFHPHVVHALRYAVESVRRGIGAKKESTTPAPPLAHHWQRR